MRYAESRPFYLSAEEIPRELEKDACTIACLSVSTDSTPVSKVLYSLDSPSNNLMAFRAVYHADKTDPAGT